MRLLAYLALIPVTILEVERLLGYRRCKMCGDIYRKNRANTTNYCRMCHLEEKVDGIKGKKR